MTFFTGRVEKWIYAHIEIVMLLGEHRQSVSSIGQLELPQPVLAGQGGGFVLTRGFDQNLLLFPRSEWQNLARALAERPYTNHDVRTLRRRLFAAAVEVTPDEKGCITLPEALRSFAGINGEVVLAGMYDHIELWSSDRWLPVRESAESNDDDGRWNDIGI